MSSSLIRRFNVLGLGSAVALAGSLALGSLPAVAQSAASCTNIRLELANPIPGVNLLSGNYVIQGTAFDETARQGTGIDRVTFFLDSRESGGRNLGDAILGQPAIQPVPSSQFSTAGFMIKVGLPSNNTGTHAIFAYAHSTSGATQVVSVPVQINGSGTGGSSVQAPAPLCQTGGAGVGTTSVATSNETSGPAPVAASASTMVLQLANPAPGATVLHGNLVLQGWAYDKAAPFGSGVDSVTVFLDARSSGGRYLGSATLGQPSVNGFTIKVGLPSNSTGVHSIFVYAHDTVTGRESSISVPVTIQ